MGDYIYLQCEDHDPPIMSRTESAQRMGDVDAVEAAIRLRPHFAAIVQAGGWPTFDHAADVPFLVDHPRCRLTVRTGSGERVDRLQHDPPLPGDPTPAPPRPDDT